MWSVEHTAPSNAGRETLWKLFAEPGAWPGWNPTIGEASFDGPIANGTTGRVKPKRGPAAKVVLADVQEPAGFTTVSRLPGARLRIVHELAEARGGGSLVTERAVLDGPLAGIWAVVLGRQLRHDMTAAVEGLAVAGTGVR
ncbi:MAG TPA: SRPBCC family protein [Solirubrobacteraceae bacterium]